MNESLKLALLPLASRLYVVGGAVRDLALGKPTSDLDLAVAGDVEAIGRDLATRTGGHFFVLHPASQTARVALKDDGWVDLVALPDGIVPDLSRRDFTMNAMALPLEAYMAALPVAAPLTEKPPQLIDPTDGWRDIQNGILRATRAEVFTQDPLRALRGLRFLFTLPRSPRGSPFAPDDGTRALMMRYAPEVSAASPERVRDEWLTLMDTPCSADAVTTAASWGFLDVIFPEWRVMEGVSQNHYHHLDVWEHTMEVLRQMDRILAGDGPVRMPDDLRPRLLEYVSEPITPGHTRRALMRQGALLHDAGKPSARTEEADGRIRFVGHEHVSEEMARRWASTYRLSGRERGFLTSLVGLHMRPGGLVANEVTPRAVQRFFRDANSTAPALFLLNAADRLAARGVWTSDAEVEQQSRGSWELTRRYFVMKDSVALPLPLSGRDVMAEFHLPPGPAIGRIIQNLRDIHALDPFPDRESALHSARAFVEEQGDRN